MVRIEFQHVTKTFRHSAGRALLRTHVLSWLSRSPGEKFYALTDVTFQVADGESLAIIGSNGAGKSTLLGLTAGLSRPDAGSVVVEGTVAALLELGSGFHPDLTGAENLILNASLLGMSRRQVMESRERIIDFAGIREFIDEPIRTYSTGMVMRLAFSTAIHTNPDILIIDEVLAVGDSAFQAKCAEALGAMRAAGKTLLIVSHAGEAIKRMCDRAIWLERGVVKADGRVSAVLDAYEAGRYASRQG